MTPRIREEVRKLPDLEKLALVDEILSELDRPDPDVDAAWASAVLERRFAYLAGEAESLSYAEAMRRYRPK